MDCCLKACPAPAGAGRWQPVLLIMPPPPHPAIEKNAARAVLQVAVCEHCKPLVSTPDAWITDEAWARIALAMVGQGKVEPRRADTRLEWQAAAAPARSATAN